MGKVLVRLDQKKLTEQISNIEKLAANCDASAKRIQTESINQGDVYPSASHFKSDIQGSINNVNMDASDIRTIMNRIIELNQNGLGTYNSGGTITFYIPESVNQHGIRAFDDWTQGVADAQTLIKYADGNPTPSVQQVEELFARMEKNQNNPNYALALIDPETGEIGAGRLLDLPTMIQEKFPEHYSGRNNSPYVASEFPDAGSRLVNILGHVLSSASLKWSDDEGARYGQSLADMCEEQNKPERIYVLNGILMTSRQEDVNNDGELDDIGLDYNDSMLTNLAIRLNDFQPAPNTWGFSIKDAAVDTQRHPLRMQFSSNPLSGVVHALTGNVPAAAQWLMPNAGRYKELSPDDAKMVVKRVREIVSKDEIGDNTWTTDWAHLADSIDQGAYPHDPHDPDSKNSSVQFEGSAEAVMTSGILNTIGGTDNPVTLSDSARMSIAQVMSRNQRAVDDSAGSDNSPKPYLSYSTLDGSSPYQPLFTDRALSNLAGQVSLNSKASSLLGTSLQEYHEKELKAAVANYKQTKDPKLVNDVIMKQSNTNGFLTGSENRALVELGKQNDANSKAANKVIQKTAGLTLGKIPIVGSVASMLANQVEVYDVGDEDAAEQSAVTNKGQRSRASKNQVTAELLKSDLFTPAELAQMSTQIVDDKEQAETIIDDDGNNHVKNMKPSELADGSDMSSDTSTGLWRVGQNLHNNTFDFSTVPDTKFEEGYTRASNATGKASADATGKASPDATGKASADDPSWWEDE